MPPFAYLAASVIMGSNRTFAAASGNAWYAGQCSRSEIEPNDSFMRSDALNHASSILNWLHYLSCAHRCSANR